jgi:hypothetical protein
MWAKMMRRRRAERGQTMKHVKRAASRPVLFVVAFLLLSVAIWWLPRTDVFAKDPSFKQDDYSAPGLR